MSLSSPNVHSISTTNASANSLAIQSASKSPKQGAQGAASTSPSDRLKHLKDNIGFLKDDVREKQQHKKVFEETIFLKFTEMERRMAMLELELEKERGKDKKIVEIENGLSKKIADLQV